MFIVANSHLLVNLKLLTYRIASFNVLADSYTNYGDCRHAPTDLMQCDARTLLRETRIGKMRDFLIERCLPKEYTRAEAAEEIEADRVMSDVALKNLRKEVITVKRHIQG